MAPSDTIDRSSNTTNSLNSGGPSNTNINRSSNVRRISDLRQVFSGYLSSVPSERRQIAMQRKPMVELLPLALLHRRQRATEVFLAQPNAPTTGAEASTNFESDEARARITAEAKAKMDEIEKELCKIVGLDAVKLQFHEWMKGMFLDRRAASRQLPHMAFIGNPGTGKSSVARTLGKLFQIVGMLPTDRVIEVQRVDLVGESMDETAVITRAKIREAEGGILFVDAGSDLLPTNTAYFDYEQDLGLKALEEIRSFMDSGKVFVIFAGDYETMRLVTSSHDGVRRRFTNTFHFDDFTCEDLAKILHVKLSHADENSPFYGFKLHDSCSIEVVAAMIERETTAKQLRKMNGGLVHELLVKARENLDSRVGFEIKDAESLLTITAEDLQAGLLFLKKEEKRIISENKCMDAPEMYTPENVKGTMDALETELSKVVGMDALKLQLNKWLKGMIVDQKCATVGLNVGSRSMPHMVFLGNPGTGKTMVARVLAKLLHMVGIIPTDNVTEVQRTDLVGKYIGQTGPKTRKMIQKAEGGILFVDEAYRLMPWCSDLDYGVEALEEIMSSMDSGDIVVIFAGYSEPMKRVISSNEGFKRRVSKVFNFDDYSSQDLAKILHLKMSNQVKTSPFYGFKLHPECTVEAIASLIERETTQEQRKELNGGLADQMLVNARENFDSRIDVESIDANLERTITLEDIAVGISDGGREWLRATEPTQFCCSLFI